MSTNKFVKLRYFIAGYPKKKLDYTKVCGDGLFHSEYFVDTKDSTQLADFVDFGYFIVENVLMKKCSRKTNCSKCIVE